MSPTVTGVGYTCHQKQISHLPSLSVKYNPVRSLLVTFLDAIGFISSKFFYSASGVVIEISLCLWDLSLHKLQWGKEREKRKEKDIEGTSNLILRHYYYHQKNLDKMNLTTSKNIINDDWSWSHLPSRTSEPPVIFGWQVWLTPITISDLIWYSWIRLIEIFLLYQWCHNQNFGMPSKSLSLFLYFFFFSYHNLCNLFHNFFEI